MGQEKSSCFPFEWRWLFFLTHWQVLFMILSKNEQYFDTFFRKQDLLS